MARQVPFINREKELTQIDALIKEWDTRYVLCIHAGGGIGKTRLLQEVRRQYTESSPQTPLIITDIIDLDDRTYHTPQNIKRRISQMLDEKTFDPFRRKWADYRQMEMAGISRDRLIQECIAVHKTFVDCFNEMTTQQRIVLFLDTFDVQEKTGIWNDVLELIKAELKNVVLFVAGRNAEGLWQSVQSKLDKDVQIVYLAPLEVEASQLYLQRKQEQLRVTPKPNMDQKILLLAQGRPILIDLAVEWRARGIPLRWLVKSNLEELKSLSPDEMEKRQQEFEYQLVHHIVDTRRPMDWLILMMSRIYPLSTEMIAKLLKMDNREAETLFEEAQTFVFVKSLPDGRISLHDEMRRMIRVYVWPEVDPDGDRQRQDSGLAVDYLHNEIQTRLERIGQLVVGQDQARQAKDAQTELNAFMAHEELERELWPLREQLLFHTLFTDVEEGVRVFAQIFDEATQAYQYAYRNRLLGQIQRHVDKLAPGLKYRVDIRRAKYLLDSAQYEEARKLLEEEMPYRTKLQPYRQIDILIQLANVEIRLGKFQKGIEYFQQAVQIGEEQGLKEWLAKAETGLGWAHRLIANLKEAGDHYQIALDLAIETGSKHQQALLYGNLGFVYTYYAHIPGNRDKALWFCNQSLSLWEELDDKRGIGRSYSTLGCIMSMMGQFDQALAYFQKALDIFEPANDREWLSVVYSWRGSVHFATGNLDLSETDLLRSLGMNLQKDRPINLSRLGQLHLMRGELDQAEKMVNECHELALQLPDVWYQLVSLRDLTKVAFYKKEFERLEEFEQLLKDYENKWGKTQDLRALGMLYLNLGRLALGRSNLVSAVKYFEQGLEILAELGRYGSDTPHNYIERLERDMVQELHLSSDQIRNIGGKLLSFWQEKNLHFTHPDVRILLSQWTKWEGI